MAVVISEIATGNLDLGFDLPEVDANGKPIPDTIKAGDTFQRPFAVTDPDAGGAAVDLTGFTVSADICDAAEVVITSFTVTPSVGDPTGAFVLSLSTAQTELAKGVNQWSLRLVGAIEKTLVCGQIKIVGK